MGQQEVIEVLESSKVPLSLSEISKILEAEDFKIIKHINKLLKYNEIKCTELDKDLAMKFYHCKRRMRLYFI